MFPHKALAIPKERDGLIGRVNVEQQLDRMRCALERNHVGTNKKDVTSIQREQLLLAYWVRPVRSGDIVSDLLIWRDNGDNGL